MERFRVWTSPPSSIIFWQNIPSIHQAPVIRELAGLTAARVLMVAENDVPNDRRRQGWSTPDFGGAECIIGPLREERLRILKDAGNNSIHIFTGIHAYPETYWTFREAAHGGATVAVYAEPVDDRGWRGALKRGLYKLHALRWSRRLDFLLLTGQRSRDWFVERGFRQEKIFPYGYFVDWPQSGSAVDTPALDPKPYRSEWLFVGQLLPRKGLDLLLYSLANFREEQWRLRVVGVGRDERVYRQLAEGLGLANHVDWLGSVSNDSIKGLMVASDALILSSRYDGWGAVVNEALSVGTPVLVSDACGAAELVAGSERGGVFKAESVPALTVALRGQLAKGRVDATRRGAIRDWAAASIAPTVAAEYLLGVMEHVRNGAARPRPPWLRDPSTGENLR